MLDISEYVMAMEVNVSFCQFMKRTQKTVTIQQTQNENKRKTKETKKYI